MSNLINDLSEFLESAIKQAKPKPIGNVKVVQTDRRAFWLEAIGTLQPSQRESEQEESHVYIEPTLEQAMAIIKACAIPTRF